MAGRIRAVAVVLLAVGMSVSACGNPAPAETPARQDKPASQAKPQPPFSEVVTRIGALLKASEVQVLPDRIVFEGGDPGTVRGLAVSEFQARNMAAEVANNARGGLFGAELDDLIKMPDGAPPISYLIAAWLSLGPTDSAKAAAELMGPREWRRAPTIVFPTAVLAAFVGDALAHMGKPGAPRSAYAAPLNHRNVRPRRLITAGAGVATSTAQDTPCSMVQSFLETVLKNVFDILKVAEGDGFLGFLGMIWNTAVEFAKTVVSGLVKALTEPIAFAIRTAVGVISVLTYAGSMLKPWSVIVVADPTPAQYGIDGKPLPEGYVRASIGNNGFGGWPKALNDCAKFFTGQELPTSDADVGSPVVWNSGGPAKSSMTVISRDDKLPSDLVAKLHYRINKSENEEDAAGGALIEEAVTIKITIERNVINKLNEMFIKWVVNAIPGFGIATGIVQDQLTNAIAKMTEYVKKYLAMTGSYSLVVQHHGKVRCGLFSLHEANSTLNQDFKIMSAVPPTGCSAGRPGGPYVEYVYVQPTCDLVLASVKLVGPTLLNLGRSSFYITANDYHHMAFPSVKDPRRCVRMAAGPLKTISAKDMLKLATLIRPRS